MVKRKRKSEIDVLLNEERPVDTTPLDEKEVLGARKSSVKHDYLEFLDQLEELPMDKRQALSIALTKRGFEDPKRTCQLLGVSLVTELRSLYLGIASELGDGYSLVDLYQRLSLTS